MKIKKSRPIIERLSENIILKEGLSQAFPYQYFFKFRIR